MSSLNHVLKFGTTALAVLVLSACGSSGGGNEQDSSTPSYQAEKNQPSTVVNKATQQPSTTASTNNQAASNQPTENVTKQPSTSVSPTTNSNQVLSAKHIGFVIPKVKGAEIRIASSDAEAADLDILNVEGKSINIVPAGMSAGEYLDITSNKNVRWGLVGEAGLNNHYLLAYGINPTTNMPTTGQVTYVGKGVHSYANNGSGVDAYKLSNAKFNVNFADKSLEGTITPADNKPFGNVNEVKLSAKIDGNQFSGKTAEGTEAAGRFYGSSASELAGSYVNQKATYFGVFGAQKQ